MNAPDEPALDRRALDALDHLLGLATAERDAALATLQAGDAALHAQVLRLLAAEAAARSQTFAARLAGAAGPAAGDRIAGYRLLRLLGRGGMSTVWLAEGRSDGPRREVALKLPLVPALPGVLAERFARERDVLAALDHPNIARLYDAGVAEGGWPYIALEAVHGQPITAHAAQAQLDRRARVALVVQVLHAVQHAHARMVVHRDLKPGNILVTDDGRVKLLDFGIAKLLAPPAEAPALTQGAPLLTPRYAAPEQVLGLPVTTATDVHAAGLVLYELLAGRLPWGDDTTDSAGFLHAVLHDAPRPPRVAPELDTVLLKAIARAPEDRYASAERFADDLQRWLDDRPILARPVPLARRVRLFVRRHRSASVAGALAVLALAATGAIAWRQAAETERQRMRADAVRNFVFSMVADAEPSEGRADVTGREMLDAAVARAEREVADPLLRGQLLAELGRVYFRLQAPDDSARTLRQAIGLLQPRVPADDPVLNVARADLARTLLGRDPGAAALAQQALAACTAGGPRCAAARASAHYALGAIASWNGDEGAALEHMRRLVDAIAVSDGGTSPAMASSLEALATTARNAGALAEAARAIAQAQAIASRGTLRAANRARLDLVDAGVQLDLGDAARARELLLQVLARPAAPPERGVQWRLFSTVELALGRPDAALAAAASSQAMTAAGPPNASTWLAQAAWAEAASSLGRHADALKAVQQAELQLMASGFAAQSPMLLGVQRRRGEVLLAGGSAAEAAALLRQTAAAHAARLVPHAPEATRTLLALACAEAAAGDAAAAQLSTEAARRSAQALPAAHPLRERRSCADARG